MSTRADLERSYGLIRSEVCALETVRDAVVVRGPDARSWLQGQASQDLAPLEVAGSAETLLLTPQGKVTVYCRATILADDVVLLDTEAGYGEALSERLGRFRLRVKAELEDGTVRCLSVRGPAWAEGLAGSGLELGTVIGPDRTLEGRWAVALPVSWPGFAGFDLVASLDETVEAGAGLPRGDPAAFEAARIEAGLPAMGRELTGSTIPQEAGDLVAHTVSFTKGCFTGQELVARLDARGGNVARRLRGVVLDAEATAQAGATLSSSGREVGALTSTAWSPGFGAPVALAYVRREVVPPVSAAVGLEGSSAEIREIPLRIG